MMVLFFSGGTRKLSDLNTVIKNNTKVYLIKWYHMARASSIEQGLAPQRIMPTIPQGHPFPVWKRGQGQQNQAHRSKELHHEGAMKCGTMWQLRLARARDCTTKMR